MPKPPILFEGYRVSFDNTCSSIHFKRPETISSPLLNQVRTLAFDGAPDAEEVLLNLIQQYPDYPFLRFLLVITYVKVEDLEQAQKTASSLLQSYPQFFWGVYAQCLLYHYLLEEEKLIPLLGGSLHVADTFAEGHSFHEEEFMVFAEFLGNLHLAKHQFIDAQKILDDMKRVNPEHPKVIPFEQRFQVQKRSVELLAESQQLLDSMPYRSPQLKSLSQPIRRKIPKVGRNEPCPCGSGKKHKKCCLNLA